MAEKIGVDFTEKDNDRLRGVSRMGSLEIVLEKYHGPSFSQQEKEALAEEKNNAYRNYLANMTPADVTAEVRETLAELHNRGYRLSIGSSSKNAKFILESTGLADCFDAISDGTNIARSKPDPEVFLKGAEFLGFAPEECAVVEDAEAGMEAAKKGGMVAVAIGAATASALADIRLNTFADLLKHFA